MLADCYIQQTIQILYTSFPGIYNKGDLWLTTLAVHLSDLFTNNTMQIRTC